MRHHGWEHPFGPLSPWPLERIEDAETVAIDFEGQRSAIVHVAESGSLVWHATSAEDEYRSRLERFRLGADVELWQFPKTWDEPREHASLVLDRHSGTAVVVALRARRRGSERGYSTTVTRGAIDRPFAYDSMAAFRARSVAGTAAMAVHGVEWVLAWDATGTVRRMGTSAGELGARGRVFDISERLSFVPWSCPTGAGLLVLDRSRSSVWITSFRVAPDTPEPIGRFTASIS